MRDAERLLLDAFLLGDPSKAIEVSEKREQDYIVNNSKLPMLANRSDVPYQIINAGVEPSMEIEQIIKTNHINNRKWTMDQYEKMGIKILDEYDELFLNVELPEGWNIQATDHAMWNDVLDEKGRRRIQFFYKGSFYDRDAFTNFQRRFSFRVTPLDDYKSDITFSERQLGEWYGAIYDCGKEIFRTELMRRKDYCDDCIDKECIKYLNDNYPLWENINAYWD